jgi:nucleotide-binding universal stress UspA family protein
MFKRILVPTDGSPRSRKAADQAITLAKSVGGAITVYYAIPPVSPALLGDGMPIPPETIEALDAQQQAAGEKYVAKILKAADKAGVAHDSLINRAAPAEGIVAAARKKKCDAILMGTHGWGAVKSLLLGSVTQRVLSLATVPVIVSR